MKDLTTRILDLERRYSPGKGPGTALSRTFMDNELCRSLGIPVTGRESTMGWCLALGPMMEPKRFFYGATPEEAVQRAEKA